MKTGLKALIIYLLVSSIIAYGIAVNDIYTTPTAINPERGFYQLHFDLYEAGGLGLRASVGLNKYIYLGLIEYIDGFIGAGEMTWNIPGVLAKVSFLGREEEAFNVALGWDMLNAGSFSDFSVPVSGPYLTFTKGWFSPKSESPHLFTVGTKVVVTQEPYNPYLFASAYFRLSPFMDWGMEFDNIPLYVDPRYHFINNQVFVFNITEHFALKFIFQLAVNFSEERPFKDINSRNLVFTYQNFF